MSALDEILRAADLLKDASPKVTVLVARYYPDPPLELKHNDETFWLVSTEAMQQLTLELEMSRPYIEPMSTQALIAPSVRQPYYGVPVLWMDEASEEKREEIYGKIRAVFEAELRRREQSSASTPPTPAP